MSFVYPCCVLGEAEAVFGAEDVVEVAGADSFVAIDAKAVSPLLPLTVTPD